MPTFAEIAGICIVSEETLPPEPEGTASIPKLQWASKVVNLTSDEKLLRRAEDTTLRVILNTPSGERDNIIRAYVNTKLAARLINVAPKAVLHRIGCAILRSVQSATTVNMGEKKPSELLVAAVRRVHEQQTNVAFASETIDQVVGSESVKWFSIHEQEALQSLVVKVIGANDLTVANVDTVGYYTLYNAATILHSLRELSIHEQQMLVQYAGMRGEGLISSEGWLTYINERADVFHANDWQSTLTNFYHSLAASHDRVKIVDDLFIQYSDQLVVSAAAGGGYYCSEDRPWCTAGPVGQEGVLDGPAFLIKKSGSAAVFEWCLNFWNNTKTHPSVEAIREVLKKHPTLLGLLLTTPPDQTALDIVNAAITNGQCNLPSPTKIEAISLYAYAWGVCRPEHCQENAAPASKVLSSLHIENDSLLMWLIHTHRCLAKRWLAGEFAANLPTSKQAVYEVRSICSMLGVTDINDIAQKHTSDAIEKAIINSPGIAYHVKYRTGSCGSVLLETAVSYLRQNLGEDVGLWQKADSVLEKNTDPQRVSLQKLVTLTKKV